MTNSFMTSSRHKVWLWFPTRWVPSKCTDKSHSAIALEWSWVMPSWPEEVMTLIKGSQAKTQCLVRLGRTNVWFVATKETAFTSFILFCVLYFKILKMSICLAEEFIDKHSRTLQNTRKGQPVIIRCYSHHNP